MAIGGTTAELTVELKFDNSKAAAALQGQLQGLTRQTQNFNKNPIIAKNFTQPLGRITGAANEFTKSLEASNARVLAFGASAGAIFAVQKAMSELVKTTITVEQKLTDINALLNVSDKQFKKFSDGLFQVARQTGTAFGEVADSANEFARQGLSVEDTLKRTNAALALSKLGMMDSVNATESLTAALNTFKGQVTDAEVVVNKLAQVDAKFAVSSKDLAEAIKRTGSSALDASVSFNELLAAVTVTQERTARGGAVIGNAFKTIFTRIQRPEVLNRLAQLGIAVRDTSTGEVLPAIQILKEYGAAYDSLSPTVRTTTAQLIAGGRQINILKALLPELAAGTGKFDSALRVANETTTEATDRLKILTSTTQGTLNAVVANLTKTASEIGTLSIKPAIDNILKGLDTIVDIVGPSNFLGLGETIGKGVYEGIGKVISGPGLILLGTVIAKLGSNLLKFVSTSGAQFLGLNKAADEQARTQTIIGNILAQRPEVMQKILSGQISTNDAAKVFRNELKLAEAHYIKLNDLAASLAAKQRTFKQAKPGKGKAMGLIPNFVPNFAVADVEAERQAASDGGYRAGQIRRMNMPGMGAVTYNGKEDVKKFPGMQQPAIMPPALSSAGKNYREKFKNTIGFDPYNEGAAFGFVPNFNLGKISDGVLQGAMKSGYFTADEKKIIGNQNMADLASTYKAANVKNNPSLGTFRNKLLGLGGKAEAGREAAKLTNQIKKEATEGGEIDIAGRIGLLSMFGANNPAATTSTTLGQLSAFNEVLDAARATDSTGKNADILSNAQITFKNVQVRSLEKASEDLANDKNEVYEKFRSSLNKNILPVLSKIGAESIAPILGNQGPKVAEIKKKLKTSGGSLLPPGAEGDIFEQVIRLATKSPSAFVKSLGDDFRAPFDFEEDGQAGYQFRKQFFGKKGFDMKALVKADAKRTADPKSTRSLIKKAYNQAILAEKSDERDLIRQFNLPYAGSTVSVVDPKTGRTAGPIKQTRRTKAGGHVPNFSLQGISDAIAREDRAGVRRDKIRVGYDRRLAASGGLGVYNTDEGSLGNAINMHMAAGRNKSQIQRQGKADGHVPNFATRFDKEVRKKHGELGTPAMGGGRRGRSDKEAELDMARDIFTSSGPGGGFGAVAPAMKEIAKTTKEATVEQKANTKVTKTEIEERDKSLGTLAGMILLGGQVSQFGETLKESESKIVGFVGSLLDYSGQIAMFAPAVETGLDVLTGSSRDLAGHFKAAGNAISEFAAKAGVQFGGTAAGQAAGTGIGAAVGSLTVGRAATSGGRARLLSAAGGRFSQGMAAGGKGIFGRLAGLQKGLSAAGKTIGRFGGILGKLVGGILRFAGPVGAVIGILSAAKGIYNFINRKEIARQKAMEASTKALDKSIEASKLQYDRNVGALDRLLIIQKEYQKALEDEDQAKQKILMQEAAANVALTDFDAATRTQMLKDIKSGDPEAMAGARRMMNEERNRKASEENLVKALQALEKTEGEQGQEFTQAIEQFRTAVTQVASRMSPQALQGLRDTRLQTDVTDTGFIKGLKNAIPFVDKDLERNQDYLVGLMEGLSNLKVEPEKMAQLMDILKVMGDQDEVSTATMMAKIAQVSRTAAIRLQNQASAQTDANDATEDATNQSEKMREAFRNLVAGLDGVAKRLAKDNKILAALRDFEQKRFKIITDSNAKINKAITTDFAQLIRASEVRVQQANLKNLAAVGNIKGENEEQQRKLLNDAISPAALQKGAFAEAQIGVGGGRATAVQGLFDQLSVLIGGEASGDTLGGAIQSFVDSNRKWVQAASPVEKALLDLKQSFIDGEKDFQNLLEIQRESLRSEQEINRIRKAAALTELKEQQKLKFGSGIFETPVKSARTLNEARQDVVAGRRLGDRDRETKGLIEQAKFFQGFQFAGGTGGQGGVNPSSRFTSQLALRFQQNAVEEFERLQGREATAEERAGAFEIAQKKALAITKDDAIVRQELIDVQVGLKSSVEGNTTATNSLSDAIKEAMGNFTGDLPGPQDQSSPRQGGGAQRGGPDTSGRGQSARGSNQSGAGAGAAPPPIKPFAPRGTGDLSVPRFSPQGNIPQTQGMNLPLMFPNVPLTQTGPSKLEQGTLQSISGLAKELFQELKDGMDPEDLKQQLPDRLRDLGGVPGSGFRPELFDDMLKQLKRNLNQLDIQDQKGLPNEKKFYKDATTPGSIYAQVSTTSSKPLAVQIVSDSAYGDQRQEDRMRRNEARGSGHLREGDKTLYKYNQKGERTGVHTGSTPRPVMQSGLGISEVARMAEDFGVDSLTEEEKQVLKANGYDISGKGPVVPKGRAGRDARGTDRRATLVPKGEMSPSNPAVRRKQDEERRKIQEAEDGVVIPKPTPEQIDRTKKLSEDEEQAKQDIRDRAAAQVKAFEKRANRDNAFAQAFGGTFDPSQQALTQAQTEAQSPITRKVDDVQNLITKAREAAQTSIDMGVNQTETEQRRIETLGIIDRLEKETDEKQKEALKTEVERNLATETFIQAAKQASEATRRFSGNLITTQDLISQRDATLAASYHDAEKTAKALNEAIGARFTYNATTFRKQSSELVLGAVDDFKGGVKSAFGEAIRGTASLREAFAKVFDKILDNILDKSLNMGVDALFGAVGLAFKKGGRVKGYNAGGFVNQGSGVRDDVPAMMQGGEYVIRKSSVNKYGRGLFDSLNSGGRVGYAMGDRIMQNRLRPEFVYNDPKRPTGGSYINTQGLSAFALMESDSPMIAIQKEREKTLENYIKDKKAYDEMVRKAQEQFKKQQKARMKSTLISVGLQAAAFGIGKMGAGTGKDMSAVGGEAAPGTPVDVVDYREGFGAKGGLMTNNGFVRGFARGGRNRDNIPAMLMGGEYVVNKRSVDKYGVGLFNDLNNGRAQGFANGGMVGGDGGGVGGAPTTANNNFEINITMNSDGEGETTTTSNQNENQSQEEQERNEQLGLAVKNAVQTELIEQQRPGGLLYREDRI